MSTGVKGGVDPMFNNHAYAVAGVFEPNRTVDPHRCDQEGPSSRAPERGVPPHPPPKKGSILSAWGRSPGSRSSFCLQPLTHRHGAGRWAVGEIDAFRGSRGGDDGVDRGSCMGR